MFSKTNSTHITRGNIESGFYLKKITSNLEHIKNHDHESNIIDSSANIVFLVVVVVVKRSF